MNALARYQHDSFLSNLFGRDLDTGAWFVEFVYEFEEEEETDEIEEFLAYWSMRHNRR